LHEIFQYSDVGLLAPSLPGSLLLANNNFYRQLTDDPAIPAGAEGLLESLKKFNSSS
jgi:hypothetical protein